MNDNAATPRANDTRAVPDYDLVQPVSIVEAFIDQVLGAPEGSDEGWYWWCDEDVEEGRHGTHQEARDGLRTHFIIWHDKTVSA